MGTTNGRLRDVAQNFSLLYRRSPDLQRVGRLGRAKSALARVACLAWFVLVLPLLSSISVGLLAGEAEPSDAVKIGVLLPPEEPQGQSLREGVLLAQEQLSRNPHPKVELFIRGRVGQWGADAGEAARMVIDDEVTGLVAPPDGAASHLVLQVSGRTGVPVVSLCADSLVSRTGVPWMLRVVPRSAEEAQALFTRLPSANSRKLQHWVALVPDGRAGRELCRDLKQAALSAHCELGAILEVATNLTQFEPTRALALRDHPDAVLVWLRPTLAGGFARSFRAGGFTGILAGPGSLWCADFVATAQQALEGFVLPAIQPTESVAARFRSFQTAYRQRWGHDAGVLAAMSYDAVNVLVRFRELDPHLPARRPPPDFAVAGVTGDLSFDPDGNRIVKLDLLQGHDGTFIPLTGHR